MWDKIMMERMSKGSFKEMTLGLIYKWTEMAEVTGYVQTLGKIEFSKQKQARDNMPIVNLARSAPGSVASQIMEHAPDIVLKVSVNTCLSDVTAFHGKERTLH
eukprot:UN03729